MSQKSEINLDYILAPENQAETLVLARALCPFAEQASDIMMLVCVAMVESGGDAKLVAEYLGLDFSRVRAHCQSHLFNRILRELTRHKLTGEGYLVAVTNLISVAGSESQTGNARNNASKTLLELNAVEDDKGKSSSGGSKDLNEMTLSELMDYVQTIKADIKSISPSGEVSQIEPAQSPCIEQDRPAK